MIHSDKSTKNELSEANHRIPKPNNTYEVKPFTTSGVPAIVGKNGVEKIVEIECADDEKSKVQQAVNAVKTVNSVL